MKYQMYGGDVELEFDEKKHVYRVGGDVVDSVTGITRVVDKSGPLMWWAVGQATNYLDNEIKRADYKLDEIRWAEYLKIAKRYHSLKSDTAATLGTLAHAWVERWIAGENPPDPINKELLSTTDGFQQWWRDNHVDVLETEFKVYSREHGYAGTCDCDALVNGERCLLDWKTGKAVYPEMALQTMGYALAREEELDVQYDARWIVVLPKDGGPVITQRYGRETAEQHTKGFLGALELVRTLKAIKDGR